MIPNVTMESTMRNMFDSLKNQLYEASNEELGPLDPNWFEDLTLRASTVPGSLPATEQDTLNTTLPSGQGESFKTPFKKRAVDSGLKTPCVGDSQLFSTPKIFRRGSVRSSEMDEDELLSPEQGASGTTLPWASQCLFGSSKECLSTNRPCRTVHPPCSFELLGTPKKSVDHSARHITESLGAQMDDVSWTSSLNTPPALSPTIILSKKEDGPCPVSESADQQIIFVRKLFPSLSNTASRVLSSDNKPAVEHNHRHQPDVVERSPGSPDASPEDAAWRQTLPDAIEDDAVRSAVASVLDGADDVLSMFFSNSSSALRRVKARERMKRKTSQAGSAKGPDPIAVGVEASGEKEDGGEVPALSDDKRSAARTGDVGITQWTPMSLSDISDCDLDVLSHDATITAKAEPDPLITDKQTRGPDSSCRQGRSQLIGSGVKSSLEHLSTKKNRKFVYRVQNPQIPVQGTGTPKTGATLQRSLSGEIQTVKQMGTPNEGRRPHDLPEQTSDATRQKERETLTAPTIPAKDHDLDDMSQLCRAFAQDFSQIVDSKVGREKAEAVQNGSRSVETVQNGCRSVAEQESSQRTEPAQGDNCVFTSNEKRLPTPQSNNLTNDTVTTPVTGSSNQKWSGFKTGSNKIIPVPPEAMQKARALFDDLSGGDITDANKAITQGKQEFAPRTESILCTEINFAKPLNSVKRAECQVQGHSQGTLTASQSADVTELCCLLEDAGSQLEFSQFKPSNSSSQGQDDVPEFSEKELDPDLLTGIDFGDSFSPETGKQLLKMETPDKMLTPHKRKICEVKSVGSSFYKEDIPNNRANSISSCSSDNKAGLVAVTGGFNLDDLEIKRLPTFGLGFTTAGGNTLNVSEKSLRKARSIFADLEDNQKETSDASLESWHTEMSNREQKEPSPLKRRGGVDLNIDHLNLNGNTVEEDIHSNSTETHTCKIIEDGSSSVTKDNHYDNKNDPEVPHEESTDKSVQPEKSKLAVVSKQEASVSLEDCEGLGCRPQTLDKPCLEVGSSAKNSCGFSTAGGKRVCVSGIALLKAKALFSGCDGPDDYNSGPTLGESSAKTSKDRQKDHDDSFRKPRTKTDPFSAKTPSDRAGTSHRFSPARESVALQSGCGFSTASGRTVSISGGALLKAKALLGECDEEENMEVKSRIRRSPTNLDKPQPQNASGKGLAISAKALHQARPLIPGGEPNAHNTSAAGTKEDSEGEKDSHTNPGKSNCGFVTAGGKKVHVSRNSMLRAKALLNECPENAGVKTQPSVESARDPEKYATGNDSHVNPGKSNCGFTTAGGKRVHVSEKSLLRAKTFLSEIDGGEMNAGVERQPGVESDANPAGLGVTASERTARVADSSPKKARSLHNDETGSGDVMNRGDRLYPAKTKTQKTPKMAVFSTAGGKGVRVSEKALQEVKAVSPLCETVAAAAACRDVGGRFGFSTASGKGVSVSEKALKQAFDKFRECENDNRVGVQERHREEEEEGKNPLKTPAPLDREQLVPVISRTPGDCEIQAHTSSSRACPDRTSLLNLESLGLSSCTVTQQEYFAQEAMDCTKALLDDEDLTDLGPGSGSSATTFDLQENPIYSSEKRKRESVDVKDRPLKRGLLAEFDRTVDCNRRSTLTPVVSCPDGMLKDRRAFKYNLQPCITRPYRNEKSSVDPTLTKTEPQNTTSDSSPGDIRGPTARIAVFVPPFRKNVNTEKNSGVPQEHRRTAGVFVPPFRKQTTVTSERSNKNAPHQLFKAPVKTPLPVPAPLTEERQRSETDTGFNGEDDTETPKLDPQKFEMTGGVCADEGGQEVTSDPRRKGSPAEGSPPERESSDRQETEPDLQSLQLARDLQDIRIMKKKRQSVRPLPGSLFLAKTSGLPRLTLRQAVRGRRPFQHTEKQLYGYGVHQRVSQISSENSERFRFHCKHFFRREASADGGGVPLADGGRLIPKNDGTAGKEEFYRALCDSPGVDPKLISPEWAYNHYRWIVWKQAAMERSFPEVMGSLCLTPEQVLLQLKYRYDVEVDQSRRPALRKVMERDDTAAKTLVLCVCGVASRGQDTTRPHPTVQGGANANAESPVAVIWLTDGWYAIKAQLDAPLTAMLHKGRLATGGKLVIHGAELVGSQDACSPLEAPDSLMLKIWANGTRPGRWDAKLGFHSDPRPFLLPLRSLYGNGGPVGCVDLVVLRSYPTQWMEKTPGGGFVFRCGRVEEKEARRHGDRKHKAMESLFAKVQAQFEKEHGSSKAGGRRRTLSRQDIEGLQEGEELYEAVENDPLCLEALSERQMESVDSYRRSVGERRQAQLEERFRKALDEAREGEGEGGGGGCPDREVTPVWKLSVADSRGRPGTNVCVLTIWRPSMELQSVLKEGCRYKVYHLSTSEDKKRTGNASVQLTVTKKTQFQQIQASQEWLSEHFRARVSTSFLDLRKPEYHPFCGEVDLVGYVISISDNQGSSAVVYLVDGKLAFVKVRCAGGLVQLGLEHLVRPWALLALSNLQLRPQPTHPIPSLYAGDLALFSTNPKDTHLQEACTQLRSLVQGQEHFFQQAEEMLSNLISSDHATSVPSPLLRTPSCKTELGRTNITPQQPIRSLGSFTPLTRTPCSSVEKDPKSLKRKRGLDYLCRIPSPPPLLPLGTLASPRVNTTFNPPRRSATPRPLTPAPSPAPPPAEEWVNDEELAMIDTQALLDGV